MIRSRGLGVQKDKDTNSKGAEGQRIRRATGQREKGQKGTRKVKVFYIWGKVVHLGKYFIYIYRKYSTFGEVFYTPPH